MELLRIGFLTVTVVDLLDIAIVSLAFYWIYKAMRDTVAIQILFGLFVIILMSFITEAVNLKSLNWIFRTISDIWLLAFVILFQPELRRLMLQITRLPMFRIFIRSKISETIDEVIEATHEFSEKHTGALIVFIRSQSVEMTVDTGISIQANISKELLIALFNTRAPLHDGAVIIQNDVIVAARCVLPLSTHTKYDGKNLGTRHRAALGLSEQVDVVVLVVSEETGNISIADGGVLTIGIPKTQLYKVLAAKLAKYSK